jgi:cell division protein FtsZ
MGLFEMNAAAEIIHGVAHPDANIIFGTVIDDEMGDEVRVTVIAAGFDRVEGSSSGSAAMPSNSASNDRGLGTSPTRITELFADSAEADPLDDDDFDVPSFLK